MKKRLFGALAVALLLVSYAALGREPTTSEYEQGVKVTPLLKTATTTLGQLIEYPKTARPEVTALEVEIAPGKETGWHKHPVPGYAYMLSGTLTIEMEDGKHFQFEAGKAFVEVINTLHNGKNLGTEPVRLVVFFIGEAGKPFTIRAVKE
jgi:quercetin dioxygenase-like cupin family protein